MDKWSLFITLQAPLALRLPGDTASRNVGLKSIHTEVDIPSSNQDFDATGIPVGTHRELKDDIHSPLSRGCRLRRDPCADGDKPSPSKVALPGLQEAQGSIPHAVWTLSTQREAKPPSHLHLPQTRRDRETFRRFVHKAARLRSWA